MFTAQDVAQLRVTTGAGMMDCKKALTENNGNFDEAIKYLREKGMAAVAKKASRIAAEGVVGSYIHMGGKIGVLVEINCETDFVAKSDAFLNLIKDIAMQIAAAKPLYVNESEVPENALDEEKEILKAQALNEGKPVAVIERMVEGRVKKYYKDVCLMNQDFIKDPSKTITQIINEATLTIGEKISIRRFTRYEMGEGLEKRCDNLAEEVAKQMAGGAPLSNK
ncbi:MAG: translation elongation factor Ts [Clostridia bacterium]|nr:translation elongation factor Ts [Clostridia bacterium]